MYTFEEIVANALTSREEVEMVSDAQIGAEQDIMDGVDEFVRNVTHAQYQAFLVNRNFGTNPFGLR